MYKNLKMSNVYKKSKLEKIYFYLYIFKKIGAQNHLFQQ